MRMFVVLLLFFASFTGSMAQEPDFIVREIPLDSVGYEIALSPDGHMLAVWENMILRGTNYDPDLLPIRLINLDTGEAAAELTGASDHVVNATFSPDSTQLVTVHRNGDINLWNLESARLPHRLAYFPVGSARVRWLPDGRAIVAHLQGTVDQFALIDIESGYITALLAPRFERFVDFEAQFSDALARTNFTYPSFTLSPTGDLLATVNGSGAIDLWTLPSGEVTRLKAASQELGRFNIRSLAITADGSTLVFFDAEDGQLHVWDIAEREETLALPVGAHQFVISPEGDWVVWISREDPVLRMASLADPEAAVVLVEVTGAARVAPLQQSLAVSADGSRLVLGGLHSPEGSNTIFVVDFE